MRRSRFQCVILMGFALLTAFSVQGCGPKRPTEIMPKMECRSPNGLRENKNIFVWKYDRVREVILKVLPKGEEGMPFPELKAKAEKRFYDSENESIGKLSWYIETVTLEMEARGELERFPETKTPTPLPKNVRLKQEPKE